MKKHVILLAELQCEFASEVLEVLISAGLVVSRCRMAETTGQLQADIVELQSPVAVVWALPRPNAVSKLRAVVEQAHELWPGIPLVGCQLVSYRPDSKPESSS